MFLKTQEINYWYFCYLYGQEEAAVRNSLGRISINARRKAYRKKSAVTIIRNGKILRIHSNRKVKSVGVVKKIEVEGDITKPIKIK